MTSGPAVFGFGIVSEIPLARVVPGPDARGCLTVRRAGEPAGERGVIVHRHAAGDTSFTLERTGERLLARCSATGTFLLDPAAATVEVGPAASPEAVEHRLLSMALPLLLAERGDVALHASALVVDGEAIAFAGHSGRGKSTIASTGASLGYPLVAEDGVVATLARQAAIAWPGPIGIRSGGGRFVLPAAGERHAPGPVPLAAVVVLGERTRAGLSCTRLEGAAAVPAILPSLIFGGSDRLRQALAASARIAERVPVYRASMPDALDALPAALETTIGIVRDEP
jgi:hypothetical protein